MAFDIKPVNKVSDAEWFLKEASKALGWGDLSENVIFDIGCGKGTSSTTLLQLFPKIKKIIAIDLYEANIEKAQANNPYEKLEYTVADILDRSSLVRWEGSISKAISTYCFNTLRETEEELEWEVDSSAAFRNLKMLLQPQGEAALLIKLYGSFDKFLETICNSEEWKPYLGTYIEAILPGRVQMMTDKDYKKVALNAGFQVVECEATERVYYYDSEEEFKTTLFESIPIAKNMDQSTEAKFKEFLLESMLLFSPKTNDGNFCIRNNVLLLLLRIPQLK